MNLGMPNSISNEGGYDSLEIENIWQQAVKPDPYLLVSEWADKYRLLSPKSAAEPGRWRTARTPYLREIMDHLAPSSPVQRIVFMKGSQVGGTECGNNWIGYVIHAAPGPMMAVAPTVELAKRHSKQRIDPLLNDVPELREKVRPARERDSGNTILSKDFLGGLLIMTGANSAVGLRSMPARYLFMDEIDAYPGDVDGEGDPILLAERRSATFKRRRKIFMVSTPTVKGLSRVQREFEKSDQRFFHVPCPECDHFQPLRFTQLRWPENEPQKAEYVCESCGCLIAEHHKTAMLALGEWRATAETTDGTIGYHLSSLYSPIGWFSWGDAAAMFEDAKRNPDLMKGFVNTVLGEPYEESSDAPEWQRLYERRQTYVQGVVPMGGLFLTAGVDVQKDRLECEIVAWGRNKENWSVDYVILDGDTARPEIWKRLDTEVLQRDWPHATGHTMPIRVMAVDSGYATQDVYGFVRNHPQAVWGGNGARASQPRTAVAVKGRDPETALILSVSKADTGGKRRGLRVWNVSGPVAKMELYRWLKLEWPTDREIAEGAVFPPGSCHFPQYGEEYFKQLTAERRVIRVVKGFPHATWEKDPSRNNEALDCRVYARAAATIYGIDRMSEFKWRSLEEALGVETVIPTRGVENPVTEETKATPPQPETKKRVTVPQRKSVRANDPYL
jgi:phage terminase large subunit GpA-like protein